MSEYTTQDGRVVSIRDEDACPGRCGDCQRIEACEAFAEADEEADDEAHE